MKPYTSAFVVLMLAFGVAAAGAQQGSTQAAPAEYKIGQVWDYKTPHGAEGSRIIILAVQSQGNKGKLVHIRIENIPVPDCGGLRLTTAIEHLAVLDKFLRKSTTDLVNDQTELPDRYLDAYREWQNDRHKHIVKRPLAEVALAEPGCPAIVNFRQTSLRAHGN